MNKLIKPTAFIAAVAASSPVLADITFMSKNGDHSKTTKNYSVIYQNGHWVGFISYETGDFTAVDTENKTYSVLTKDTRCELMKIGDDVRKKADNLAEKINAEIMAANPELQKAVAAEAANTAKDTLDIQKSDERAVIAGYDTTKYEIFFNENLVEVVWLAEDEKLVSKVKNSTAAFEAIEKAVECDSMQTEQWNDNADYKSLMDRSVALKGFSAQDKNQGLEEFIDALYEGELSEEILEHVNVTEIEEINFAKVPASEYTVPKGYKKVKTVLDVGYESEALKSLKDNHDVDIQVSKPLQSQREVTNNKNVDEALDKLKEFAGEESEAANFLFKAFDKIVGSDDDGN